jgi:hypothetical protein
VDVLAVQPGLVNTPLYDKTSSGQLCLSMLWLLLLLLWQTVLV